MICATKVATINVMSLLYSKRGLKTEWWRSGCLRSLGPGRMGRPHIGVGEGLCLWAPLSLSQPRLAAPGGLVCLPVPPTYPSPLPLPGVYRRMLEWHQINYNLLPTVWGPGKSCPSRSSSQLGCRRVQCLRCCCSPLLFSHSFMSNSVTPWTTARQELSLSCMYLLVPLGPSQWPIKDTSCTGPPLIPGALGPLPFLEFLLPSFL